jgi:4-hydroxymandelate oxidase
VDSPQLGLRRRDLRNGFVLEAGLMPANLDPQAVDDSITWADLAWLREISTLPILVKGILTAEDARLAVEHGLDGVVVSNHGGRQLDGAVPAIVALPEVVVAIDGRITVLVDGSIRNGRDVFVALALGAQAVLVGRPVLWSLAVGGSQGVADMLNLLTREFVNTMALAGRPHLADINRSALA